MEGIDEDWVFRAFTILRGNLRIHRKCSGRHGLAVEVAGREMGDHEADKHVTIQLSVHSWLLIPVRKHPVVRARMYYLLMSRLRPSQSKDCCFNI